MSHPIISRVIPDEPFPGYDLPEYNHEFMLIRGRPTPRAYRAEPIIRPGVDGIQFRKLPKVAQPFTVQTIADFTSASAAQLEYEQYTLTAGGRVAMSEPTEAEPSVAVFQNLICLGIRLVSIRPCLALVGNNVNVTSGGDGYLLVAEWSMLVMPDTVTTPEARPAPVPIVPTGPGFEGGMGYKRLAPS